MLSVTPLLIAYDKPYIKSINPAKANTNLDLSNPNKPVYKRFIIDS